MAILNHQRVYNIIVLFLDKVQYKPNSYLKKDWFLSMILIIWTIII